MPAAYKDRIERIDRLERLILRNARALDCPDTGRLLDLGARLYEHCATLEARRRAIQRDLEVLVEAERIEIVNPGSKPHRYRCRAPN